MIYENREDRLKQSEAVAIVQSKMPHRHLQETAEKYRINHDFVMLNEQGLKCGVGEIKCRTRDAAFFRKNGWLFEVERIESLHNNCERMGFPVMLVLYTSDKVVFWVKMSDMFEQEMQKAPASWMKNNHGTEGVDKNGIIIPIEMMHEIKLEK